LLCPRDFNGEWFLVKTFSTIHDYSIFKIWILNNINKRKFNETIVDEKCIVEKFSKIEIDFIS
jgi:hypothetical protein